MAVNSYIAHLSRDKKLAKLLKDVQPFSLKTKENICFALCSSIMSQQLSVKVAQVFHQRFLELLGGSDPLPRDILAVPYEKLRSIGLSHAKATYIHSVAQFAEKEGMELSQLQAMDNEALIAHLTKIRGVGKWTAEMLMMFSLGREDVFSADDFGIQQAMIKLYKLDPSTKKEFRNKMIVISSRWAPYRTYACLHLWNWKDTV